MKKYIDLKVAQNILDHALISNDDREMLCKAMDRLSKTVDEVVKDEYTEK